MLNLDYRDARPIYEQVRDGLRRLMVTGAIQEGEKLPSVRSLASRLAINPNTIQRAYESLEAEGYLYSVPGKGSFAAPHTGVDQGRKEELLGRFDAVAAELLFLGVGGETLVERVHRLEGGETGVIQVNNVVKNLRRVPGPGRPDHVGGGGLHLRPGGPQRSGASPPSCGISWGVYRPDSGSILVDGQPVYENPAVKGRMAWIPDDLYYFLSASTRDMMRFYRGLYPQFDDKRYQALRDAFPAVDEAQPIRRLSKGMQKQSAFWLSLCCMPDIMVLDEPVDGLDPVMRRQVWSLLMGDVAQRGDHRAGVLPQPAGAGGRVRPRGHSLPRQGPAGALSHRPPGQHPEIAGGLPGRGAAQAAGGAERAPCDPGGPGAHPHRPGQPGGDQGPGGRPGPPCFWRPCPCRWRRSLFMSWEVRTMRSGTSFFNGTLYRKAFFPVLAHLG